MRFKYYILLKVGIEMKTNTSTTKLLAICMAMILLILTYHMPLPVYGPGLSRVVAEDATTVEQIETLPVTPEGNVVNAITPNPETT